MAREGRQSPLCSRAGWRLRRLCSSVTAFRVIAARHEIHPKQVSAWKRRVLGALPEEFARGGVGGAVRMTQRYARLSLTRQCALQGVSRSPP